MGIDTVLAACLLPGEQRQFEALSYVLAIDPEKANLASDYVF